MTAKRRGTKPQRVVREAPPEPPSPRRLLLDTHVWIWWQADDRRLGVRAREAITGAVEVRFSAASAWEIGIKATLGKLALPRHADIEGELRRSGFQALPIDVTHALAAAALPAIHRDPFDRILIAQSLVEGLTLVTADTQIGRYEVATLMATQ